MLLHSEDYLDLSGIQHFVFCPRQWALIHIEQQWAENERTVEGRFVHARCHDEGIREKRGDVLTVRGLRVISHRLRLTGICDVVEFCRDPNGVPIRGEQGLYMPLPIEYKRGRSKVGDEDRAQVCAQAMALEEMFCCEIQRGVLFYAETKRREVVDLDASLRLVVADTAGEMNDFLGRGYTPRPRKAVRCQSCSIKDICEPGIDRKLTVKEYIQEAVEEMEGEGDF